MGHIPCFVCRTGAGRIFLRASLAGWLLLVAVSSDAAPAVKQVLVLQSFDRGNLILDHFTANLRVDLDQGEGGPVNAIQVVVGPTGFIGAPQDAIVDFIRSTFADRKNLALAADAGRRQTMAALTGSIAHDLGQPLSSIIYNARALQMMVTANRATSDTIGEILSDIQTQGVQATQIIDRHRTMLRSHQLEMKPTDLHAVINDSLALVDHDMRARQIEATFDVSSNPCVISGDHVLLQQVLVKCVDLVRAVLAGRGVDHLVVNAMDAMADTPPARRRVTIRTELRAADVVASVRDTGTGVPAQINDGLFAPFVTTKANGLGIGLTIARTIVEAHGGTLEAHNNPEGGATFTMTLRRSEAPESLSVPGAA